MKLALTLPLWGAVALGLMAPTAEAAKGVKKAGMHTVRGRVMSVQRQVGAATFVVKTAHRHKKVGAAVNPQLAGAVRGGQMFQVLPATRFQAVSGSARAPASFASLRQGALVKVRAQGQFARQVQIVVPNRYAGSVTRHRHNRARFAGMPSTPGLNANTGLPTTLTSAIARNSNKNHARHAAGHGKSKRK